MKRNILFCVLIAGLFFTACIQSIDPAGEFTGGPDDAGLVVGLQKLTLDKTELATVMGYSLELKVTKSPVFANVNDVTWTSSDENVATVDQNGHIETNPEITEPQSTLIRVFANADPSVYAECSVMVYPDYTSNRYWNFGTSSNGSSSAPGQPNTSWYANSRDAVTANQKPFGSIVTSADSSLGLGMTLKGQTGSGEYEPPSETPPPSNLPLSGGVIPSDADKNLYPVYPWEYNIDPEDPYVFGLTPRNGTRTGIYWRADNPGGDFRAGNLVTNGNGRILSIAALKGSFYIEVRYQANSSGSRWAEIRIGDKDGFRIQGEPSLGTTAAECKKIFKYYEQGDDDIVPYVFIEAKESIRIYEIIILPKPPNS